MMKGLGLDESMSNLTSTISGETSISSNTRNESSSTTTANTANTANTMLYPQASSSSFASPNQLQASQPPPAKKKRNLPGNPDPDAEVIALSPKSLLATNRFLCEICNKGFQRDQNLQLHRRGHNLPWKLKQRAKDQVIRKKVYVCPELGCVHHDPARALGDLTGIKKHFCRKHGEKKWKCEKCSKKYAVQSDWKAHSKICGTREYRCDCGTLFSRRDSFITHRAFCDALAEESGRGINPLSTLSSVQQQQQHHHHISLPPHLSSHHQLLQSFPMKREPQQQIQDQQHASNNNNNLVSNMRVDIPPWLACPPPSQQQPQQVVVLDDTTHHHGSGTAPAPSHSQLDHQSQLFSFQAQYDQNHHHQNHDNQQQGSTLSAGPTLSSFQAPLPHPQMSATALLQKAAEMGVTVSNQHHHHQQQQYQQQQQQQQQHQHQGHHDHNNQMLAGLSSSTHDGGNRHHHDHHQTTLTNTSVGLTGNPTFIQGGGGGGQEGAQSSMLHDVMLMNSMQTTAAASGFDTSSFGDFHHQAMNTTTKSPLDGGGPTGGGSSGGGSDGMTRDFLGLRTFSHKDFLNMAGLGHMNSSSSASFDQQQEHHNQTPW